MIFFIFNGQWAILLLLLIRIRIRIKAFIRINKYNHTYSIAFDIIASDVLNRNIHYESEKGN